MSSIATGNAHRRQLNQVFNYLKDNLDQKIVLGNLAHVSGFSQYHFIRIFNAYTGETPFTFLRRERVVQGLQKLSATQDSITDIALDIGFESSSSFNKAFKKVLNSTPSEFRNMGKDRRDEIIYDLSMTPRTKEIIMTFEMNLEPEIINRNETIVYATHERGGDFKEVAPLAWEKFLQVMPKIKDNIEQSEFMGIGFMDVEDTKKVCDYKAALSMPSNPNFEIEGLKKQVLPASKYAKFLLKGSYDNIWIAFDKAFEIIGQKGLELADLPCLENYLNNPEITPVEDLLTEILVPIK